MSTHRRKYVLNRKGIASTTFYRKHEQSPSHDAKIVTGDMNAQVGKGEMYCPTIGKQSLHEKTNDNGYRLIHFATLNNMVIGSRMFQRKNVNKPTWMAPDRSFES